MIANYYKNPELFVACLNLLDESFPGCKEFALNGVKFNACWNKASTPFILKEKDEIIAHAGVWPITFMLNGKEHRSASIHGVCVKTSHRGKGLFKRLMQEVIEYVDDRFDSSILFTSKPYLYKNFPYKIMLPEYDFILNSINSYSSELTSTSSDLKLLQLQQPEDLTLINKLLSNRIPLSNQFSIINANTLFILDTLDKKIHYSEKLNVLIVYEISNKTLYLKEIVSENQIEIKEIIKIISGYEKTQINKIVLQFCPDRFLDENEYLPDLARPECCVMTSKTFNFNAKYFRYPELYWC